MMMITAYTIDEKKMDVGGKQTAKLHEEGKYTRESARNYGDHVVCMLLSVLAFFPPQLLL